MIMQLNRILQSILAVLVIGGALVAAPAVRAAAVPTFTITAVEKDKTVTIKTADFPANQSFTVTMGPMGGRGINGIVIGTVALDAAAGGELIGTFQIPEQLKGSAQIAIRLQTGGADPYFAYNWFYNVSTGSTGSGDTGTTTPPPTTPAASGVPSFLVTGVKRDQTVTITTKNFPANQTFTVLMGPFGSKGINGHAAGTWSSGAGGEQSVIFNIPQQLHGSSRIAIRLQTGQAFPYYAYNWFYNSSTP